MNNENDTDQASEKAGNHGKNARDAATEEYDRLAPHYDRRWSFYIAATLRETRKRLDIRPGERVLDVGCGTGVLLEAISASAPGVTISGVDPSAEMLEVARKRLNASAILKISRAESLPFPDEAFSVVVSTNAFHYIRDPLRALREMRRVLEPAGRIVITDWCDDFVACRICDLFLQMFNRAHVKVYGANQIRRMLEDVGFTTVQINRFRINWLWGLMTAVGEKLRER